jgi:hypothetical protein
MRYIGERRYSSTHSLASELDGGEWSASHHGRFTPRERAPGTHWIKGWVGPRAVLDAVVKRKILSPRRESNPRTSIVQPAAQHKYKNLTAWRTVLIEELMVTRLLRRFPNFCGTCGFFAVFAGSRRWSYSWGRWIQSPAPHPVPWGPF